MDLMFQPLEKYAVFSGRARRKEFWLFQLLIVGLHVLTHGIAYRIGDLIFHPHTVDSFVTGVDLVLYVSLLLPNLAVTVRRFHDMDRRGWWVLIAPWLWFPIWLLDDYRRYDHIEVDRPEVVILTLILILAGVWFIVLMSLRGTRGENRFGPDPLSSEPGAADPDVGGESPQP